MGDVGVGRGKGECVDVEMGRRVREKGGNGKRRGGQGGGARRREPRMGGGEGEAGGAAWRGLSWRRNGVKQGEVVHSASWQ